MNDNLKVLLGKWDTLNSRSIEAMGVLRENPAVYAIVLDVLEKLFSITQEQSTLLEQLKAYGITSVDSADAACAKLAADDNCAC